MSCNRNTEWEDNCGDKQFSPCTNKAKYIVTYKDHQNNLMKEELCGVHKNSIEKWAKRLRRKMNYNVELTVNAL